ncbi:unnamed protein product [Closterium sp. Naga37s-1]|nr:unnamed protein product [Closterium sp. Naga37s-1]
MPLPPFVSIPLTVYPAPSPVPPLGLVSPLLLVCPLASSLFAPSPRRPPSPPLAPPSPPRLAPSPQSIEFWKDPERSGWLTKQGEYIKTWRRRWFVLKEGHMFWFKDDKVSKDSQPRGVINVGRCLTIKGAEDVINRAHAFELSTSNDTLFFIADSDKEKEDWINSVGRAIVRHSRSVTDYEVLDYDCRSHTRGAAPPAATTPPSAAAAAGAGLDPPSDPSASDSASEAKEERPSDAAPAALP